jgi:cytochrome c peroxidase
MMNAVRAWLHALSIVSMVAILASAAASARPDAQSAQRTPQQMLQQTPLTRAEAARRARQLEDIGSRMFVDPTLSGSGQLACASCHSPRHAFGPPNARATQMGGPRLDRVGLRAVPSLRYLQARPPFTEHFFESDEDGDESLDAGPTGGLTWDGRVNRGRDQARIPLLSPDEMANDNLDRVVEAVSKAPYARQLRQLFGEALFDRDHRDDAFEAIVTALATYEQREAEFYPYSSKFDASLAGEVRLSEQEQRGLRLFEDPAKGNCARCHVSRRSRNGAAPQFTDYGFVALGVPRNTRLPANADPAYYDLGLCGPLRTDLIGKTAYCGRFITPSLRNVAVRHTFFHNGAAHSLRDAVAFYATRDTTPERWYPRDAGGRVRRFDDLPVEYQANVETGPPFGQRPGDPPALTDQEIDDLVAFLGTLTDGVRTRGGETRVTR